MGSRRHLSNIVDELKASKAEVEQLRREHASMQSEIAGLMRTRDAASGELAKTEKVRWAARHFEQRCRGTWWRPSVLRFVAAIIRSEPGSRAK